MQSPSVPRSFRPNFLLLLCAFVDKRREAGQAELGQRPLQSHRQLYHQYWLHCHHAMMNVRPRHVRLRYYESLALVQ